MLGFHVDSTYVVFGYQVFQQSVGIPMDTNSAPLLADLFLYSFEAEFVQKLSRDKNKKLGASFDHITDISMMSFQSTIIIFPIKSIWYITIAASYLDTLHNIDSNDRLTTTLYEKCVDFNFATVNFPFLCSNVPLSPAYGVYTRISKLIQYARACVTYENFSKRCQLLTK
jgi:hypothetical protein